MPQGKKYVDATRRYDKAQIHSPAPEADLD